MIETVGSVYLFFVKLQLVIFVVACAIFAVLFLAGKFD